MAKHTYTPKGVCSSKITFDLHAGVVKNVRFKGGCSGNLQALSRLVEGLRAKDVLRKLKGIDCDERGTSCADQLAKAVRKALKQGTDI